MIPLTHLSSPSTRQPELMRIACEIGLASFIDKRIVELRLCKIGDDATDPAAQVMLGIGIGLHNEEPERGIDIGKKGTCFSRKDAKERPRERQQRSNEGWEQGKQEGGHEVSARSRRMSGI